MELSDEERRKCTPSSSVSCTETPLMVVCGELSTTMPFFAPATVKPVRSQYAALKTQNPYPEFQPAVGAGQLGAVPEAALVSTAVAGPVRVTCWPAVPAVVATNGPAYVPGASRMVFPGRALARAVRSSAPVARPTMASALPAHV